MIEKEEMFLITDSYDFLKSEKLRLQKKNFGKEGKAKRKARDIMVREEQRGFQSLDKLQAG